MQEILLAQKARAGNRQALERLVRKYYQEIYNYIYSNIKREGSSWTDRKHKQSSVEIYK